MQIARLILWDVDHTLLETGGVGGEVFRAAFQHVTGRPATRMADPTGQTEPVLFRETLRLNDLDELFDQDLFPAFAARQAEEYARRADELRSRGRVLPGVTAVLSTLAKDPCVVQTVVTGNTKPAAAVKLETFDLSGYLDLDVGAYGTDSGDRADLIRTARRRISQTYSVGPDVLTVLLGDTPADVAAGLRTGCKVVGVATGNASTAELAAAGASVTLAQLSDAKAALRAFKVHR